MNMSKPYSHSNVLAELWMRGVLQAVGDPDNNTQITDWQHTGFIDSSHPAPNNPRKCVAKPRRNSLPRSMSFHLPPEERASTEAVTLQSESVHSVNEQQLTEPDVDEHTTVVPARHSHLGSESLWNTAADSPRSSLSALTVLYNPQDDISSQAALSPVLEKSVFEVPTVKETEEMYDAESSSAVPPAIPRKSSIRARSPYSKQVTAPPHKQLPAEPGISNVQAQTTTTSESSTTLEQVSGRLQHSASSRSQPSSDGSSDDSKQQSLFTPGETSSDSSLTETTPSPPKISRTVANPTSRSPEEPLLRLPSLTAANESPMPGIDVPPLARKGKGTWKAESQPSYVEDIDSNGVETSLPSIPARRSQSPSEASISRIIMETRVPGGRMEPHDVRRLDGVEVADGIELATQNTDGSPVPEMEAEEVNDLPTPPEAQMGLGLVNTDSDCDFSTRAGRLRAASPPPPPNYDPDYTRKTMPRAANHGRAIDPSQFVTEDSSLTTKMKNKIVDTVQHIKPKSQASNETSDTKAGALKIPEPEIKGPGSIPEAKVIGPPPLQEASQDVPLIPPEKYHLLNQGRDTWPFQSKRMGFSQVVPSSSPIPEEEAEMPVDSANYQREVGEPSLVPFDLYAKPHEVGISQFHDESQNESLLEADGHGFPPGSWPGIEGHSRQSSSLDTYATSYDSHSRASVDANSDPAKTSGIHHGLDVLKRTMTRLIPGVHGSGSAYEHGDIGSLKSVDSFDAALPPDIRRNHV